MRLDSWAVAVAQVDPGGAIQVQGGDRPLVYGALTGAILVLATVIAVLWRRGERRNDRMLKAAEEAREREVARADWLAARMAEAREAFAELRAADAAAAAQALDKQRADLTGVADRERAEHGSTLRAIVERQVQADGKLTEAMNQIGRVLEATSRLVDDMRRPPDPRPKR